MKKILFAIAIVLTLGLTANAQRDGFFANYEDIYADRGTGSSEYTLGAPVHGLSDVNAPGGEAAPLGSGLLILTALGAGYAVVKHRKK